MNNPIPKYLELTDIHFSYDKKNEILAGLNLKLNLSEITGICGLNGAGKSTLLKILAGVEKNYQGEIKYSEGKRPKIGYVYPWEEIPFKFTVYDLVAMGRFMPTKFLGILDSNDKKIIEEVLQQTELWSLKDRLINTLSSGEKQRVQIARALAQEPEFLLLDEPFNFLDIAQLAKTIAILQQRHQDYGTGMLIVSHNTRILAVITAKTLFLKNGKVLLFGTTNEVLTTENISKYFTTGQAILF